MGKIVTIMVVNLSVITVVILVTNQIVVRRNNHYGVTYVKLKATLIKHVENSKITMLLHRIDFRLKWLKHMNILFSFT